MKSTSARAGFRRKAAPKSAGASGSKMHPNEVKRLAIEAKDAYRLQLSLGNIEDGLSEDDWRRKEVLDCVGKAGLSACSSADFDKLFAHFLLLSGKDADAFSKLVQPSDEHRRLAFRILEAINTHQTLASADPETLAADRKAHQAAIAAGGGPIGIGYLVSIVRAKAQKPRLTLGEEPAETLARCLTVRKLEEISWTILNRISTREGRADADRRAPGKARAKALQTLRKAAAAQAEDEAGGIPPRHLADC